MRSSQWGINLISPPRSHVTGAAVAAALVSNVWTPAHNGKDLISCVGARLLPTADHGGFLAVHLVDDASGVWYLMDLTMPPNAPHGTGEPAEFDLVGDSTKGTTVALDATLIIYPGQYKDGTSS